MINFSVIYADSFNLYKVFDNLNMEDVSMHVEEVPKTFWQLLNHLVSWQAHQLQQLGLAVNKEINEPETWIEAKIPESQKELDSLVHIFKNQIDTVRKEVYQLTLEDPHIEFKLKTIQEMATHLSFHLGEIIVLQRMLGKYPLPHQMREFLNI